ncbi:MAG: efflux RND transporter periplasmic adaptor subunit [Deltaproteobacteria bacterium]|nr:efflux RND transporter periplasmic adaptor subunit [Deltaproteobacteria bacterium]
MGSASTTLWRGGAAAWLALVLCGCGRAAAGADAGARDGGGPAAVSVTVVEVVSEEISRQVDVTGTLAAWEEALVSVEADGRLVTVAVDLGARVRRGQPLAQIAPQEYALRRAQAEADLEAARADHARTETLVAQNIATRQQLDEARRRLELARSSLELARKKLADTAVRSPLDGTVSRRLVNAGELVRTGTPAFQVVRASPLKLRAEVPERYAADVKVGDPVRAWGDALGGAELEGKVVRIGPAVAEGSRSFPVEAKLENPAEKVKPGSFARVAILTATRSKALTVPESAVVEFAGNPRVFVVQGSSARERPVEIEGKIQGRVMVRRGLQPGERVVVSGLDRLSDGTPIAVRPEAAR